MIRPRLDKSRGTTFVLVLVAGLVIISGPGLAVSAGFVDNDRDGFEDGDLSEYDDVEAGEVTTATQYQGDASLVITDRNTEMFKQGDHYTGNRIHRDLPDGQPNRLAGAVRIGAGDYNDLRLQWRNETGAPIVQVNLDTYNNAFFYNGTSIADISANTWYYVEFVGLNWETNTVNEIVVDGRVVAQDMSFLNDADRVHNLTMSVNDAGTGSKAWFDEITIATGTTMTTPTQTERNGVQETTESSTVSDRDGDGVPDSEDYAPDDPDVQVESDVEDDDGIISGAGPGFTGIAAILAIVAAGLLLAHRE